MQDSNLFTDIDLSFIPHPHTGDITSKVNQEAIKRSVKHALMLEPYDIPFNASLKSSIKGYLFEGNNRLTRASLESDLKWLLTKVEPRIELQSIDIKNEPNSKSVEITIVYKIKSINITDSFQMTVEKIR